MALSTQAVFVGEINSLLIVSAVENIVFVVKSQDGAKIVNMSYHISYNPIYHCVM